MKEPNKHQAEIDGARYRAEVYQKIRSYFQKSNVLEVETPLLSSGSSVDANIDVIETISPLFHQSKNFYLQTSPELFMKRMLARGYPSVFQICKAFRLGESGPLHNPEFSILEWYQLGFGYRELMEEVWKVFQLVIGSRSVIYNSYQDTFKEYLELDPLEVETSDLKARLEFSTSKKIPFEDRTDLLNYAVSELIQPVLPPKVLYFIFNYPKEQACLAKIDKFDNRVANRFECFFNGIELCNGFEELLEHQENKNRFEEENQKRKKLGKTEINLDQDFINEISKGMPLCSGVAVGLDRLLMLGLNSKILQEVMPFKLNTQ